MTTVDTKTVFDNNFLADSLVTSSRCYRLLEELEDICAVHLYNTAFDFNSLLESYAPDEQFIPSIIRQWLSSTGIDSQNISHLTVGSAPARLMPLLSALVSLLRELPSAKVTFAVDLPFKTLQKLYPHFKDVFDSAVVLDIHTDPKILGGVVWTYNGIFKDLSLDSQLDAYFVSKPDYVNKLLSK